MNLKKGYFKRADMQLNSWINGKSIHNDIDEECCPDFSCCVSNINTPIETRKKFADAHYLDNEDTKMNILMGFFVGALQDKSDDEKIYISKTV